MSLSDGTQSECDYLLVANGHHAVPRHPEWKSNFTGEYLHAHAFKTNQGLENKRILVVGAGNSGCDCAVEASRDAAQVDISLRTPQYIIPKFVMGKPTDSFAASLQWLPQKYKTGYKEFPCESRLDVIVITNCPSLIFHLHKRIQRSTRKYSTRYGMARYTRAQTFKASLIKQSILLTAHRHNTMSSSLRRGYKISFPFDPDFINWKDAEQVSLYLRIFHPVHPSLFFIGLLQPQGCIWTLAEVQSKLIGQLLIRKSNYHPTGVS